MRETAGPGVAPDETWFASDDEARRSFDARVTELRADTGRPELRRVELVIAGRTEKEEFIVRTPRTYR